MASFDDREKAFETKHKKDEEFRFKVNNRRNKLLGLWVADQFGLGGDAQQAYAKEVVQADFDRPGDADVVEKVLKDFQSRGIEMSEHRLRKHMDELLEEAKKQVMAGQ